MREDLADPPPGPDEIRVRVRAASVNPVDNALAAGVLAGMGLSHDYPVVLGRDYAGVVHQAGSVVSGYDVGDRVFGFVPLADPAVHAVAWRELVVVNADGPIARVPDGVDLAAAGAAALARITALALIDAVAVAEGYVVLVVGATGGVGSVVLQLAARAGARVLAPPLPEDEAHLRDLGATDVLDRNGDVLAATSAIVADRVDALVDCVNFAPGTYDAALRSGARVASPPGAADEGTGRTNVMAEPSSATFSRLAELLADGTVRVPIQETYGLADAATAVGAAHAREARNRARLTGHRRSERSDPGHPGSLVVLLRGPEAT